MILIGQQRDDMTEPVGMPADASDEKNARICAFPPAYIVYGAVFYIDEVACRRLCGCLIKPLRCRR